MVIGLLTGGSDCQGLNAAIRSIIRSAIQSDIKVVGFNQGWKGLLENHPIPLGLENVSGILPTGGSILGTSRINPKKIKEGIPTIEENLRKQGIDVLVGLGGVEAQSVLLELHKKGFPVIGVPATLDNDIGCTEYCIGFMSSVDVVADALDKLHTTASSHHRVIILEVMGRRSGWIALYGGLAGGADWIIIPEVQTYFSDLADHLKKRREMGKYFSIIVVAESAKMPEIPMPDLKDKDDTGQLRLDRRNIGMRIGEHVEKTTGFETRVTVLGHLQRGGSPVAFDRILATRFGSHAVEMAVKKQFGKMAAFRGNNIESVDLAKVVQESPRPVPIQLYNTARMFY
ncbi:MAG: 6-phosphofructokinase [Firmicutes bacterium]|nr:6-phosphofructokinase [Bacillota bacterium]